MKFFIDSNGKCYKAEQAHSIEDMERLNCSQDQLDALPDDGSKISQFKFEENLRLLPFKPQMMENQNAQDQV